MTDDNRRRIEKFRPRLARMLQELTSQREFAAGERAVVQLDQQSVGRLSRIDAMQAQQVALAADRQRQVLLARIRRALERMDSGEFGTCAECGGEISEGRLDADPAAHLCIGCASAKRR
jgi:DnaK suppressor protein